MNPLPVFAIAALLGRNPVLVCAVAEEAERRGIDPVVVVALVEHESNFCPWAQSATRDYGLMQIHAPVHGRYRDTRAHIAKGVDILAHELIREHGNMRRALSRYNTGKVSRRGLAYADRVLSIAARLRRKLGGRRTWNTLVSSSQLGRSDSWSGWWCPDFDPRKRRLLPRRSA